MKTAALCFASVLALTSSGAAVAQQAPPAPPPPPGAQPTPDQAVPPPVRPTSPPAGVQVAPPAYPQHQGYSAPPPPATTTMGRWTYTTEYGWIWLPPDATTVLYGGVPYAYLYTPTYGWTWYVSPWGPGRVRSGDWVRHAWHPRAPRPWVAPPAVSARLEPLRYVAQPHVREERGETRGGR